ncbi:hypothetical protein P7C70_g1189, partial [Phenoliferia sp. Uapishka_3]
MAPRRSNRSPLALAALALAASPLVEAAAHPSREWESHSRIKRSNTVTTASSLSGQTFDYVIVGGGTAGLVLAARLSENSSATVAVVEAGGDGSDVLTKILAPAEAYFSGIATKTSPEDWHFDTTVQSELNDREIYWPRGKLLGGSSAVNGVYMCRSSKIEHDSWASLYPGANTSWSWDAIYPYMKSTAKPRKADLFSAADMLFSSESETWTAPLEANAELAGMVTNVSLHGTTGPIISNWIPTLETLGVETRDPAGGETWGAYIAMSAIDPRTWSRSYSKTGYLDPASTRNNLVVLTGYYVTKVLFDNTTATGVSFQAAANGTAYTVNARQEVILAGGVIGSPHLLQVSGVGDSDLLTSLGIDVVVDLPGVGMHLTDHLSAEISFNTTNVTITGDGVETTPSIAAAQLALWEAGNVTSLYNSPTLFGETAAATLISELNANKTAIVNAYSNNTFVRAGYNATYSAEVRDIYPSPMGQAEILMVNTGGYGSYSTDEKIIGIQAAIQHPLSRGSVKATTTSIFDSPVIDPGYFTHPGDIQVLREAFKFARSISQTAPMSSILTNELNPGLSVSTDAQWETWIRDSVSTEYHPAGTCSMLPLELGGVVDINLRVHGTSNLRVIDSSKTASEVPRQAPSGAAAVEPRRAASEFIQTFPACDAAKQGSSKASLLQATYTSIYELGCLVGAVWALMMGNRLGRRKMMQMGVSFSFLGVIEAALDIGRTLTGIGNGMNTSTIPSWVAETSRSHNRGLLVCIEASMIATGTAIAYWVDFGLSFVHTSINWRLPIALQILFAVGLLIGVYFLPDYIGNKKSNLNGSVFGLFLYLVFFGATWLELPWLYPAEINPLRTRTNANAVSTISNWLWNFAVVQWTPPMLTSITWGTFLFFAVINALFIPVIYFWYPETSGRTLEEIDLIFAKAYNEGRSYVTVANTMPHMTDHEIAAESRRLHLAQMDDNAASEEGPNSHEGTIYDTETPAPKPQ